jgi:hypothetical protein
MKLIIIDETKLPNPCIGCEYKDNCGEECDPIEVGQQSILSKAIPIEKLEEIIIEAFSKHEFQLLKGNELYIGKNRFSQYLQEKIGVKK